MPDKGENPTAESVQAGTVSFPESIFLVGSNIEYVPEFLKRIDRQKHLCIGNVLDPTPPIWMHHRPFAMGKRLVTNGEYLRFLESKFDKAGEGPGDSFYDDPELWRIVWEDLNLQLTHSTMAVLAEEGNVIEFEEVYHDARNALDAYLTSLRLEMQRLLVLQSGAYARDSATSSGQQEVGFVKRPGKRTEKFEFSKEKRLARLFTLIRFKLRNSIFPAAELEGELEDELEAKTLDQYENLAAVSEDIRHLISSLREQYLRAIDERFRQAFIQRQHPVETIQFLERFRTSIKKHENLADPVRASDVFYPRFWTSPAGARSRSQIRGRRMPWEELPINGVSLYEAAAYTVWLGELTELDVTLPTEFEYERAASWGRTAGCIETDKPGTPAGDNPVVLDPRKKDVLPWRDEKDFNFYFGREGAINPNKRKDYERLLEATGRHVDEAGKERIDQLLGFGWQWSIDRYNETERKYNRFENPNYPLYTERPAVAAGAEDRPLTVYAYEPYRSLDSSHFVLRGSPDVIGGAGLTTRRFAVFPLRGCRNISFRIAIRPEDSADCGGGL